jgi:hypothetical protein
MTGLDIFTFVVMFVLVIAIAVLIKILGSLPGKIARHRNHPQADAVNVCGWLGIVTLGLAWPIALVWAYTRFDRSAPPGLQANGAEIQELNRTLEDLTRRIQALEQQPPASVATNPQ